MADARIQGIYRYPVKGLSPEPMPRAELAAGKTIACDRMYAIENGPSGFDPAAPAYLPKVRFLMLMRNARLAELRTRFDDQSHVLTIRAENREAARGGLRQAEGPAGDTRRRRPNLLGGSKEGGRNNQSPLGGGTGNRPGRAGASAALPRQS